MRVRLDLEYDGSRFRGWAAQPGLRTVQGELTRALEILHRQPVELVVAGRTDGGVHARGQVVSYDAPELPRLRSLNALLPDDAGVFAAAEAAPDFDARRSAIARAYEYRVHVRRAGQSPFSRGRELWWPHPVDRGVLDACAAALPGTHDFTAFTPTDTEHVLFRRTVHRAAWSAPDPDTLVFAIEAPSFMRNMNRVLVGTMLETAAGRRSAESFAALLEGAPRSSAGPTAAPHGLYLVAVRYA